MDIVDKEQRIVGLSDREVILLANALNEICNGIEVPEFETRIGATMPEAKVLLSRMKELLERDA